jgi:hypothetical protein
LTCAAVATTRSPWIDTSQVVDARALSFGVVWCSGRMLVARSAHALRVFLRDHRLFLSCYGLHLLGFSLASRGGVP